eukprot:15476297-Alexandrium_andersonii.AAC.1
MCSSITLGYPRLPSVIIRTQFDITLGRPRLPSVTLDYPRLSCGVVDSPRLPSVTLDYPRLTLEHARIALTVFEHCRLPCDMSLHHGPPCGLLLRKPVSWRTQ